MPHHPAFMEEAVRLSTVVVPSTGLEFARGVEGELTALPCVLILYADLLSIFKRASGSMV